MSTGMGFRTVNVRVGDNLYVDVEYRGAVLGEKVNIDVRYEDGLSDMMEFWPANTLFDDESILDHGRFTASQHHLATD